MCKAIDWVVDDVVWQYTNFIMWVLEDHIILLPFCDIEHCIPDLLSYWILIL